MAVAVGASGKTEIGVGVAVAVAIGSEITGVVAVGVGVNVDVAESSDPAGAQLWTNKLTTHKASQRKRDMERLRFMTPSLDLPNLLDCFQMKKL